MALVYDTNWDQISHLLDEVLDLPSEKREAYLASACADDPTLRREIETLLDLESEAQEKIGESVMTFAPKLLPEADEILPPPAEMAEGERIGSYRIVRQLGQGGMGTVYLAQRADGLFEQAVAIKLIKRGFDTDDLLSRFTYERQILAALDHPNIARLYDGGMTSDGQPYFIMEYVDGVPLNDYCDHNRLTTKQRLALFRTVCRAVQYAHQNLIVHRDLKPSNILVTEDRTVKLLDFGIAKLLDEEDAEQTAPVTRPGMRFLTPEYASPEQIRGEAITTATDVYQLGVLLYELLTGRRPYRLTERLKYEIERVILEEEPTRPSMVVGQTQEVRQGKNITQITPETVSEARSTTAEGLQRRLSGDLDNIVLKALKKDAGERYGTVEQFAEDLKRHLVGLPVSARRETLAYRMRKFVQRNKAGVAAAVAIAILLVSVAGLAIVFAVTTVRQNQQITQERDKARQVTAFLADLFKMSDPRQAQGETVTAREMLDAGAERVEEELSDQPDVQAEMMGVMSQVYRSLGLFDPAEDLAREALRLRQDFFGQQHLDVALSMNDLGLVLRDKGNYAAAESLHQQALATQRSLLGNEHPEIARSLSNLGAVLGMRGKPREAELFFREALAMQRKLLGNNHEDVPKSLTNLATALRNQANYEAAELLYREALEIRRKLLSAKHPDVAWTLTNLASLLTQQGNYDEAEPLFRDALAIQREVLDEEHPALALTLQSLASVLSGKGDYDEAEAFYREALTMQRHLLGPKHPNVAWSLDGIAWVLSRKGNHDEAEALFRQALAIQREVLDEEHSAIAWTLHNLASVLTSKGDYDEAEALYRQALTMRRHLLGPEHTDVARSLNGLALVLSSKGDYDEAEPLFLEALAIDREKASEEHSMAQKIREGLADLYTAWGKPEAAARYKSLSEK